MAQYYYTVASLPVIQLGQEPGVSSEYFLDSCRYTLSEKDYNALLGAFLIPRGRPSHPAVALWYSWEIGLRNELAKLRAQNTGIEAQKYLREGDSAAGSFDAAREAAGAQNPAQAEESLDQARWRFLEEMEIGHIFDMTRLIVYYLKLQIAERRQIMSRERGSENYRELYNSITERIQQSQDGEL